VKHHRALQPRHLAHGNAFENVGSCELKGFIGIKSKASQVGVEDAAIAAFASTQPDLDIDEAKRWAAEHGVALVVFLDWTQFIEQALHWSGKPYITLERPKSPGAPTG
jgi:hypothetical protein